MPDDRVLPPPNEEYFEMEAAKAFHYSFEKFIEVTEMTARLDVVFRKVGGSAEQLTGDIIQLAAANARDTREAMESATEWARLGLTRKEVAEATRVSMAAANVAHMKSTETTRQLSTLMHVYHLQAEDLNGVLGMLTATSQRYNVTLEDLFTGLDRSAATAKQARMSLGELQGIIAVMVGRTGQTGIIIGNTVKNILTQFSNPTMQQYLRVRGIETMVTQGPNTGQLKSGSQILRDVFVRYMGMKPAEQLDMARNLAGRLQVGRFQSLMEGYVDAQKLAVDTQLRLNAAQEANVRILGTLKAQLTELRVEWDRLAMNAGRQWGPGLAEWVRMLKNTLRAGNGSWEEGQQKPSLGPTWYGMETEKWPGMQGVKLLGRAMGAPKDFRDESGYRKWFNEFLSKRAKETGREMGVWEAVWASAIHPPPFRTRTRQIPLIAMQEAMKRKYETPYERGEEEFQNKVQEQRARALSAGLKARLFETVGSALPLSNHEMVASMASAAASEMSFKDAGAFRAMQAAGDRAGMQRFLKGQTQAAQEESKAAAQAEIEERSKQVTAAKAAIAVLDEQIQKAQAEGKSTETLTQQREEFTRKLNENTEARARSLAYLEEELGKTEQAIFLKQEYINLLKQEELVLQTLNQLSQQGNPDSMGVRLDSQVGSLRDEVALLEAQKDRLERHALDIGTPEAEQAKNAVMKELSDKRAQLAAQDSPQMRQLAAVYDARVVAERRAHADAATYAVGYTESGKLLAEERRVQEELARLRQKAATSGVSDNEAVRAKQMEIELTRAQEQIQGRILDLARQERQIRLDALREFNKGLLLAGPGELLQRLQASQLMHRNVSPGEFFALSPDVRRLYFEARGGDAMMMNRWEQRQLRRAGWARPRTVEEEQAVQGVARSEIERWNALLRRNSLGSLTRHPDMPLPDVAKGAKAVADSLFLMQGGVLTVTEALARLYQVVDDLNRRHAGPPQGARRMDISAGHALGALPPPAYQWSR